LKIPSRRGEKRETRGPGRSLGAVGGGGKKGEKVGEGAVRPNL